MAWVEHGAVAMHYHWMYVTSPFLGAALAACLFFIVGGDINAEDLSLKGMWKTTGSECMSTARGEQDQIFAMRAGGYGAMQYSVPKTEAIPTSVRVVQHSPVPLPSGVVGHQMFCGCSWKVKPDRPKGMPAELCDIDLSCAVFSRSGGLLGGVYFADRQMPENGLFHSGDEIDTNSPKKKRTSDNEFVKLKLSDVKAKVHALIFVVTIFGNGRETFGDVREMCIRLVDVDTGQKEICRFEKKDLDLQSNAIIVAMLFRSGDSWAFKAVDESFYIEQPHQSYRALEPQLQELVRREANGGPASPAIPPLRGLAPALTPRGGPPV